MFQIWTIMKLKSGRKNKCAVKTDFVFTIQKPIVCWMRTLFRWTSAGSAQSANMSRLTIIFWIGQGTAPCKKSIADILQKHPANYFEILQNNGILFTIETNDRKKDYTNGRYKI